MAKNIIFLFFSLISCLSLYARDYPQWPTDKPETDNIKESQNRETRLSNGILTKEIDMQDKMRTTITDMMTNAAKDLFVRLTDIKSILVFFISPSDGYEVAPALPPPPELHILNPATNPRLQQLINPYLKIKPKSISPSR